MEARDFRSLGRAAQEALRRRALFLIERAGVTQTQAAQAVGVHRRTVNIWLRRYRERGEAGVLDGRRVSPRRGKGLLTAEEAGKVRGWIAAGTPDALGLPFALRTGRAVRELVERRLGKRLGLSTVRLYLQRWGMTPRKPLARARERSPAAIRAAWLERDYPAITKRAKAEQAAIHWGDETGISNQDQTGRSHAPKGQTPVIARTAKRVTQGMISAVSDRGLLRFMLHDGALNAAVDPRCGSTLAFLRRLVKDAGRKVFRIVDNLKVHHAKKVTAWVASHAHGIALFHLPAYAPEHDPDEYLNHALKRALRQKPQPDGKDEPVRNARAVLRAIQRSPDRVRTCFAAEPVRYAA